jgi:hypothetical protein
MISSRLLSVVAVLLVAFAAVTATAAAAAGPGAGLEKRAKKTERKGGKVRAAWPRGGAGKPAAVLERWLARQVGPRKPRACVRLRRCQRDRAFARTTAAGGGAAVIAASAATDPLALVRSYDIPADDPSYDRLLNWSWTYDSAVTAAAFAASGLPAQAERLLDQLRALQRTDGSIDTAFNNYTGEGTGQLRAGTVGWTGLAAATYGATRGSSRYDKVATDAADWILARRDTTPGSPTYGLVRGGPDVSWYSTQHNLIAYILLTRLSEGAAGDRYGSTSYGSGSYGNYGTTASKAKAYADAATAIAAGIERRLLVEPNSATAYFRQGYGDDVRPLDTQTLGAFFLLARGNVATAAKVRAYINSEFAVSNRSIVKSAVTGSFNNTFAAAGPFSGYRPYADATGPDVLWAEGTAQVRLLEVALFDSSRTLDATTALWDRVSGSAGPLQADRTVTGSALNEYHVWPTAAAAAWRILSSAPASYFVWAG